MVNFLLFPGPLIESQSSMNSKKNNKNKPGLKTKGLFHSNK